MTSSPPDFLAQYESVAPALRAWAVLRCRGPLGLTLEADDLVQETCIEAFRSRQQFAPDKGTFRGWIFGIATRVAGNALRSAARRHRLAGPTADTGALDRVPADVTTLSRRVRRDEALVRFLDAAAALDAEERRLLLHRGLEGLEHAQVGHLLGVSPEVAAKRWQRLRERLSGWPQVHGLLAD